MKSLEERQKILIVDDSKFNQELLMEILGENYQYILANDGLQATQVIRSFDHDIPIVAMTANAFMEDKIKAKKAGMNAHVSKPLDRNILIQVIAKLCGYKNV